MDTYKATNTLNGNFYIGSTTNFEKRKKGHLKSKENYPFQNALRKNPEVFEWEVWSDDSDEPLLEQALLDMWFGKECCYNLNPFAKHPPSWKGRSHSNAFREKMRQIMSGEANKARGGGWSWSETAKEQASERTQGEGNNAFGETWEWPTESLRFGAKNPSAKRCRVIHLSTGEQQEFNTIKEAAETLGITRQHLAATARGDRKQHKGYKAEYI